MKKWEYKRVFKFSYDIEHGDDKVKYLNKEGEDGWELVETEKRESSMGNGTYFLFKREKV